MGLTAHSINQCVKGKIKSREVVGARGTEKNTQVGFSNLKGRTRGVKDKCDTDEDPGAREKNQINFRGGKGLSFSEEESRLTGLRGGWERRKFTVENTGRMEGENCRRL